MRESPSVEIMQLIQDRGAEIEYSDPYVPVFPKMRRYSFDLSSVDVTVENIKKYDCVVVGTDHVDFDYKMIGENAKLIIDTRGMYRDKQINVVNA